jgi:FlaA1/EpsC-like NDP-sugar epimerase
VRTLIVGAGQAGRALARDLRADDGHGLQPIGFVDDAREDGDSPLPILGTLAELTHLIAEHKAEAVVPAIPGLPTARSRELIAAAIGAGAVVRYLPWYTAASSREAAASDLRPLDIRALIDGPEPHVASPEVKEIIAGKRVLVTGTDGPLGSEISSQVNAFSPGALVALDDFDDLDNLDQAFRAFRPEAVFHAAGLRNAAVLERRPSRGVKETVLGTDNLVRAATAYGTERFINISTDADPASMLGASQRVAEAVVQAAAHQAHQSADQGAETVFATVRIGDVLDARDSLLTTLPDQIRAGGPVTVTHPDATRCFATAEEAVALALDAARMAGGGEVYVLDVGEPMRVADVVSRFTRQYRLPEVPIRYVGLRQRQNPRPDVHRVATPQPQIFTTTADEDRAEYARLPERLDKLYKAADKNRDPKVRQMLLKLAAASAA